MCILNVYTTVNEMHDININYKIAINGKQVYRNWLVRVGDWS